ncbi:MAG: serine/threonine-protein kinase, partial [Polyangiaceae bacterium]
MKRIIGRVIAKKYLVRDVLGRGGNAVVYEALDRHMQRPVAIKIPTLDHDDADLVLRRFRREVRASGAVVHPNVCATHASGQLEDGIPFLVMERLEGESLAERLRRQQFLPLDQAITIFAQVLSGLSAAHARRILHRDIKPAN